MDGTRLAGRAMPVLIFGASLASLGSEVALIRVFSISLWYHFAFMVISIAMLGIGASGTFLSLFPKLKDLDRLPRYGLWLALAIPSCYLLANAVPFDPARISWDRTQAFLIVLYYVILCIPFFCFGLIVSTAYSVASGSANAIYAADLTGAGMGAAAMIPLLSLGGPEVSMFIISAVLSLILVVIGRKRIRALSALLFLADVVMLLVRPEFAQTRLSPYKPFAVAMQFPGVAHISTAYGPSARIDLFTSPGVRFAPGLSLEYLDPLPGQTGAAVDGGDVFAMTDDRDAAKLGFLRRLPVAVAYGMNAGRDVLVLEPCTGLSLLAARRLGAGTVTAIDSHPLLLRVLRDYSRSKGSSLYDHDVRACLARSWLASTGRTFDIIDFSLTGVSPTAGFGFVEDYRFTVEAFTRYLAALKPDGLFSLTLYMVPPPRMEFRLAATLARAAEALGMDDIDRHLAVIRSWNTVTLLMKKSFLTENDIRHIRSFSQENRFDLVYYPGIRPEETNIYVRQRGQDYADAFRQIVRKETRRRFMADYLFDIRPATDDKPFFHYYLKAENIRSIFRTMGNKWEYFLEQGYLLPVLFLQVLAISAVLILLPLAATKRKNAVPRGTGALRVLFYFAFLGFSYLFVETAFIQHMVLGLGNPVYAASAVIASLLISSGMGSLIAGRSRLLQRSDVLFVLGLVVILYGFLLPPAVALLSGLNAAWRTVLCFSIVMPAGLLMGIPFPLGISIIARKDTRLIPWAWAINGSFSVLAPVLATMLALASGFRATLLLGALLYMLAYGVMRREPARA